MKVQGIVLVCCTSAVAAVSARSPFPHFNKKAHSVAPLAIRATDSIEQKWFTQVSDHFEDGLPAGSNKTFQQRFYVDTQYYKPGGPVIVLDSGEDSGEDRLPFMKTGIVKYLSEALGGIGIVLEHRYYGESHVTKDLSTESMKLLNTAQALADNAYFAKNLGQYLPKNMSHISPDNTPFISYGGSYAGAKSAFLQAAYPEVYYGSLASSGVIWAGERFWEYYEPQRIHGNRTCIRVLETVADRIDNLAKVGGKPWADLKQLFGVETLEDRDAANTISFPVSSWQSKNWDTTLPGEDSWDQFCTNITTGVQLHKEKAQDLGPYDTTQGIRNYAAFMRGYIEDNCLSGGSTVKECFDTGNPANYSNIALANDGSQDNRLWTWQVCTEYGYFQTGAPDGHPTIVSRLIDVDYLKRVCNLFFGFPADHHPDTSKVLKYGGFNLTGPRLMYIDGSYDPWLYATAHSPYSPQRHENDEKSALIDVSWHHNDENGLGDISKEPARIQKIHNQEIDLVGKWVKEFHYGKQARRHF